MKERKSVIRIENKEDGRGIFRSYAGDFERHSNYNEIYNRHQNKDKFPAYGHDIQLRDQINYDDLQDYYFAFKSLEQLRTGFTDVELKEAIEELGFQVLMLDVTDYYESDYQIVFNKESIVEEKDISFMFL